MINYRHSRNGLFLIELIISIFFFIVSCAVALQLFAKSYSTSQAAVNCRQAAIYTQNIAELFLGNNGDFNAVKQACSDAIQSTESSCLLMLFDKDWCSTDDDSTASYAVYANGYRDNTFSYIDIYVYEYSKLYTENYINKQTVKKYVCHRTHK